MESEATNQINNHYDDFFYATMCHVCKRFGDGVQLKKCRDCKMIYYCGKKHQRQHWKQHKPLCEAIQVVLRDHRMDDRGETTEEWAGKKLTFAQRVSSGLGRHLNAGEMDMFLFPKECLVCHEWKSLQSCWKCAASLCQIHRYGVGHRDICAPLELCLRTDLFSIEEGNNPPDLQPYFNVQRVSYTSYTFCDMKDFIKVFGNVPTDSDEMPHQVLAARHSEYLTRPLTLFYAMRSIIYDKEREDLVIHVVGASVAEECTLIGWEVLPHLTETAMSVTIVMIGPELKRKFDPSGTCDGCASPDDKSLIFKYHDALYENYVRSPSFVKPDLVVGFNLDICKHELGSEGETWAPSIKLIAEQNCPFVLTSVTSQDSVKKIDRINAILGRQVDYICKERNLFASLRPHRVPGPEHVCFRNQHVVIYQSLCS